MASTSVVVAPKERTPVNKYVLDGFVEWEVARFPIYVDTDIAHVVMQAAQGNISNDDAKNILEGLLRLRNAGVDNLKLEGVSLVFMIENALAERIGKEAAGALHVGRSRIDQTATVARLSARPKFLDAIGETIALQGSLLEFAKANAQVLMPYHTHQQHSQPGTAGHFMLAYFFRLQADLEACQQTYAEINKSPLGTAGRCGTPWNIDRDLTAELLGFEEKIYHSLQGRDPHWAMNTAGTLQRVMFNLSDMATDIQFWLTSDVQYAELDPDHCSISSIFPHKKNPLTTDRVRGVAASAAQWFATAFTVCKGMGTGDHQIRQVPDLERWIGETREMATILGEIVPALTMNEERLYAILEDSWTTTTSLVDTLTREEKYNVTYREAHEIVVTLVKRCKSEHLARRDVNIKLFAEAAKTATGKDITMTIDELKEALDAKSFTEGCISAGGVSPKEIAAMIKMAESNLEENRKWLEMKRDNIAAAGVKLNKETYDVILPDWQSRFGQE